MKTKITNSSVETKEFRLNHRDEFTWFKNIITQDDADEYGYLEDYDQDDTGYENDIFQSEMITNLRDPDNYIAKEVRYYDVPENFQEWGFRIVTPYQWWETPPKDPNNPIAPTPNPNDFRLESTGSTTNLLKGSVTLRRGEVHDKLRYASVNTDEVIVLPLNEGEISDSGFFAGIKELDTDYFWDKAEDYCEDLSTYLQDSIPLLAADTILEEEKVPMLHGVEVTKIYFQVFYGETAQLDDFYRLKEWEPLDFRYDMTPGEVFGFDCNFIRDYSGGETIWKGSNTDTLEFCVKEDDVAENYFTFNISYNSGGIEISDVKWRYAPTGSDFFEDVFGNCGPVTFAIVGFEGSLLYPKFKISGSRYIPTGEKVQLELNKYSRSYEQISLMGQGFEPISYTVDGESRSDCHYVIQGDQVTFLFIDQAPSSQSGVCFNLWMYNNYELPTNLAEGVEWQINLEAHSGEDSRISASSTPLPFEVSIPHILYNKNLYKDGYATLSNTIKDNKTYATLSKLFVSNVTIQDVDGDGITTSKDQIFAHDGSINTVNTRLKNVKITRLKGGQVYDPDKE